MTTRVGVERPAPALSSARVEVGGRPASYLEVGSGRTVVFLHGWGVGHRAYRATARHLAAAGVRVLAPALPGFSGTASLPPQRRTLQGYAAWVIDFLDALGVREPVLLVGHSFGGGVAIVAARQRPDRVGGLVLVNSIGGAGVTGEGELVPPVARRLWDWGVHFAKDVRAPARLARVLPIVVSEALPNLVLAPRSFVRTAALAKGADLSADLAALARRRMPIVVLWGRRDQVISDASLPALRALFGDDTAIAVPGGHNWLLADPAHFGEVMTNVVEVADWASRLSRSPLRRWWRRRRARRGRDPAEPAD